MPVSVPAEPDVLDKEDGPTVFRRVSLDMLTESAIAFFKDAGMSLQLVDQHIEEARRVELALAATIGFVSEYARGTLTLVPDPRLITRSHPIAKEDVLSAEQCTDWLGEMANQILGRCKNRLVAYGITLLCDTPLSVSGSVRLGTRTRRATAINMRCGEDPMRMWWDVDVDPALVLGSGESAHQEGELCLF